MSSAEAPNSYLVKRIRFFSRDVPIFLQNLNGPCPLLALANVLSLRNELRLPAPYAHEVPQDQLVSAVAERLLEASAAFEGASPELASDMRQNVSDSFGALSKLATGVDVNVKFTSVHAFEPTNEVAVFDLLGINLVHGWLVDPADTATAAVFGSKSYNELVEMLFLTLGDEEAGRLSSMRSLPGFARTASAARHSLAGGSSVGGSSFGGGASGSTAAAAIEAEAGSAEGAAEAATSAGGAGAAAAGEAAVAASSAAMEDAAAAGQQAEATAADAADAGDKAAGTERQSTTTTAAAGATWAAEMPSPGHTEQQPQQPADTISATPLASTPKHPEAAGTSNGAAAATPGTEEPAAAQLLATSALPETGSAAIEGLLQDMVASLEAVSIDGEGAAGSAPTTTVSQQTAAPGAAQAAGSSVGTGVPSAQPSVDAADAAGGMVTPAREGVAAGSSLAQAHLVRDFLERHCSQLTEYGLSALQQGLRENQLAVFFRNNHFNTVFKHGDAAYLLVTDQGYASEPDVVWERLDSVNSSTFCTTEFHPFVPHRPTSYADAVGGNAGPGSGFEAGGQPSADADYALALQLQLQEEEEQRAREERARQRQQQEQQEQQAAAAAAAAAAQVAAPSQQQAWGQQRAGVAPSPRRAQPVGSVPQRQTVQQAPEPLGRLGQAAKQRVDEAKEKCSIM